MKKYFKGLWERTTKVIGTFVIMPVLIGILMVVTVFYLITIPFVWLIGGSYAVERFITWPRKVDEKMVEMVFGDDII